MDYFKKNHKNRSINRNGVRKTLKMFVLIFAIAFSTVLTASTNPVKDAEPTTVTETVGNLLKNPDFQLNNDVNAMVYISINQYDEMVVLSVDTGDRSVERFIKSRLNYKKLSKNTIGYMTSFKIPVKIIKAR